VAIRPPLPCRLDGDSSATEEGQQAGGIGHRPWSLPRSGSPYSQAAILRRSGDKDRSKLQRAESGTGRADSGPFCGSAKTLLASAACAPCVLPSNVVGGHDASRAPSWMLADRRFPGRKSVRNETANLGPNRAQRVQRAITRRSHPPPQSLIARSGVHDATRPPIWGSRLTRLNLEGTRFPELWR
jgi:hypothetical protein